MHRDKLLDAALSSILPSVCEAESYCVHAPRDISIKLNQNECASNLPEEVRSKLASVVASDEFHRYPREWPGRLTEALATHTGWPNDGILVGNGSNDLMYTVAAITIVPGTRVVLPSPLFSLYEKIVRLNGGDLTSVAPNRDLSFDVPSLIAAIRLSAPSLVVIATPNNPTGLALDQSDIFSIAEETRGIVFVDEAYLEYSDIPSVLPVLDRYPNVLLLRTFSKAYGLAGLRLGYIMGNPEIISQVRKARYPFAVDRIAEAAALMQLERHAAVMKEVAKTQLEVMRLYRAIREMDGMKVLRPQANFLAFCPPVDSREVMGALIGQSILVRDLGGYEEMHGYLRVTAGTQIQNNLFLSVLADIVREDGRAGSAVSTQ